MLASFGDRFRTELPDGRLCYLPLSWTDWKPRPAPLSCRGQPVRLAPEGLLSLTAWIRGRAGTRISEAIKRRKLDIANQEDQKRKYGVGDKARGRAAPAAVVGKAGASSTGRAHHRKQRRGKQ